MSFRGNGAPRYWQLLTDGPNNSRLATLKSRYTSIHYCAPLQPPSSNTTTLVCGSETYKQRFGDYGYDNPESWCCIAFNALSGQNASRPSLLPESAPFECTPPLTSPSETNLDVAVTLCNYQSDASILIYQTAKYLNLTDSGTLLGPNQCGVWRGHSSIYGVYDVSILLYRHTEGTTYNAAARLAFNNQQVGVPQATVQTKWSTTATAACWNADFIKYNDFKEGVSRQFTNNQNALNIWIRRDKDQYGAKQFAVQVWDLKSQVDMGQYCQDLVNQTISYTPPLSASEPNNLLDTAATVCNSLLSPILVFKFEADASYNPILDSGTVIAPGACFFWRDHHQGAQIDVELLLYRSTGGSYWTASAIITASNSAFGYPTAEVTSVTYKGAQCWPAYLGKTWKEGETQVAKGWGHYQVAVTRNPDAYGAKQFLFNVQELEGQIITQDNVACDVFDMTITYP